MGKVKIVCVLMAVLGILAAAGTGAAAPDTLPSPALQKKSGADLAGVRVPFIKNTGQIDERVGFYANTFAGTAYVTKKGGIVYALPEKKKDGKAGDGIVIKEALVNAGKVKEVRGEGKSSAGVNSYKGNDKSKWKSDLPTYEMVSMGEVYKGIEFKLKAHGNNVEKLFFVKPGADPLDIKLAVEGPRSLRTNEKGELEAVTDLGTVTFAKPVAYQAKTEGKKIVDIAYAVNGSAYGFKVGDYDKTTELVIDPILQSTYLGGSSNSDHAFSMAIDGSGNVYVTGGTYTTNFPGTTGGYQSAKVVGISSNCDAFVSKLNSGLTSIIQSTYLGGSNDDSANAITIGPNGNIYIAGSTKSSDFPIVAVSSVKKGALRDAFIAELSPTLTSIVHSTFLGGSEDNEARAIAIDSNSYIYVAGITTSTDFPKGTILGGAYGGGKFGDAFVAKYNPFPQYYGAVFLGGSSTDYADAITLDSSGNIYIAGSTNSTDFPGTTGGAQAARGGGGADYFDGFVTKLSNDLYLNLKSTYLGGDAYDNAHAIAIDSSGNVYVGGTAGSSNFPGTAGGAQASMTASDSDAFVTKLNSGLTSIIQSTYLGGSGSTERVRALAIDSSGNVYAAGSTNSTNFPGVTGGAQATFGGGTAEGDAFVSKLNSGLTSITQSTYLGGSFDETAFAMLLDGSGNIYIAGQTTSTNLPGTTGGAQASYAGSTDAFVSKLDSGLSGSSTAAQQYTLTVSKSGTGKGTVTSSPSGINCGSDCSKAYDSGTAVTLTASADSGSTFTGWSGGGCTGSGTCVFNITAATTVTATFTASSSTTTTTTQQYSLAVTKSGAGSGTVTSSPSGIDCGDTCTAKFDSGTEVTLTASAADGSVLADWSVSGCPNTSSTCKTTISADTTVTAAFVPSGVKSYTLKTVSQKGGTVTSDDANISCDGTAKATTCTGTEKYYKDDEVILTATASSGYTFNGWMGCTSKSDNSCTVKISRSSSVTAKFKALKQYTLKTAVKKGGTVTSDDGNISCNADNKAKNCTGGSKYEEGTDKQVKLTATPVTGYSFTGWSGGGCSGTGDCTLTMNANKSVTAKFKK